MLETAETTLLVCSILRIWSDDVLSHSHVARVPGNETGFSMEPES